MQACILLMEGHRAFIKESDVKDEEWKWSLVYLVFRDFFDLAWHLLHPWKHKIEEWS
jgi:hypothetical protein